MRIATEGCLDALTAPELQAELANKKPGALTQIILDLSKRLRTGTPAAHDFALCEKALREGGDYAEAGQYFDALPEGAETAAPAGSRTNDGSSGQMVFGFVCVSDAAF